MVSRKAVTVVFVMTVLGLFTAGTGAWAPPKVNHLTFNRAVALPGVVLPAGEYTFEAGPAGAKDDVVQVRTRRGNRVVYTGFTLSVSRPPGMAASQALQFGEAATGEPPPIAIWYPIDAGHGHEFLYE